MADFPTFDVIASSFGEYAKNILNGTVPPPYEFDPITGQVRRKMQTSASVFTPPTPTAAAAAAAPTSSPVPTTSQRPSGAGSVPVYAPGGKMPENLWRETPAAKANYKKSADLYSGFTGQMGDFARQQMQAIQTWNDTYNNTGGPQVRAFAANPYGYDATGSIALKDAAGIPIYADETDKIAEALKRLQQPVADNAPQYTPYYNAAMPDRFWVV